MKAGAFIRMVKMFRASGSGYLWTKGHVKNIVDALTRSIKANGGQVLNRARAKEIKVNNSVVGGVIDEQEGKEIDIDAPVVINNAGPKYTVEMAANNRRSQEYEKGA